MRKCKKFKFVLYVNWLVARELMWIHKYLYFNLAKLFTSECKILKPMTVTMKLCADFTYWYWCICKCSVKLLFFVRSDQGGSRNLFSDNMQILIHLMLLLFLMINSKLVHTKVKTTKPTRYKEGWEILGIEWILHEKSFFLPCRQWCEVSIF